MVRIDTVDDGLGQHASALQLGPLHVVDAVVHGADGADRLAIVIAAAGRTALPWARRAALRNRHGTVAVRVDHFGEALVAIAPGHHVHRVRCAALARRLQGRIVGAGHAHFLLGAAIVRFQFIVGNGPVAPYPVIALHAHVGRQMAPARRGPVPGRATHRAQIALLETAAVGTGYFHIIILREIQRCGRVFRLRIQALEVGTDAVFERHVAPVFHGLTTLDAQARFQHDHGVTLRGQLVGHHGADDARADDDDIGDDVAITLELG
ncbi:hypothetical protein D3C72_1300300 [compost metagenome]